jgi:genome maintenance exonuclease 1
MIIDKIQYHKLNRTDSPNGRQYVTPAGESLPSVTTILSATKDAQAAAALQNWRDRIGHEAAAKITNDAANVGTFMHEHLENYALSDAEPEVKGNFIRRLSANMASCIIKEGMSNLDEIWGVEVPLYFPGLYAGTTDLVGQWNGNPAIIDFKQTLKPKTDDRVHDYKIQLVAYALAHNEVYGTDIKTGVILMCSQQLDFQQWVLEGADWDYYVSLWLSKLEQFYSKLIA